jgi:signal transduction histidine kinase
VIFEGSTVVAKVGAIPNKDDYVERLRTQAERLAADGPASGTIKGVLSAAGRKVDVLMAAAPIGLAGDSTGLAVVALARSDAVTARTGVFRALLLAAAVAVALAIVVGWLLGGWMTRPLRRLSAAARRMAQGSYEQPVTGSYAGEVRELADSMEVMRREVESSEQSLRGFVASAAHELRTPLTSIQGFSEALLDGTADTEEERQRSAAAIYRESTRLQRLVDALLTLSRYDSHEFQPNMTTVDVEVLVREEVDRLVQAGLAEPGRVVVSSEPDTRLTTDSDMLRQVIANLLRNAAQYGGMAPVGARIWKQRGDLLLEVTNEGEALTGEERARLFARFYRGKAGRLTEGFGLGLSLVREICDLLGGKVELVEGGPTIRFRVTLPLTPLSP